MKNTDVENYEKYGRGKLGKIRTWKTMKYTVVENYEKYGRGKI